MSNDMVCPTCGIHYNDFRTGFIFADIFAMFWRPEHDPKQWVYKRRNTILGRWHQIKKEMWEEHLEQCIGFTPKEIEEINDY